MKRFIALCLALCLLLTGCAGLDFGGYFGNLLSAITGVQDFSNMEYTRPDMDAMEADLNALCAQAAIETNLDALLEGIYAFYGLYDDFSTAYSLALIHYYRDLTDSYWETEYNFCMENSAAADAALDKLYRALAKSPLRTELEGDDYFGAGYFDYYDGESLYDETLLALMDEDGYPAMTTISISKAEGVKWLTFCTSLQANSVLRARRSCKAGVCVNSEGYHIALTGTVEVITVADVKREMWYDALSQNFSGSDDPDYCVLRFTTEHYNLLIDWQAVRGSFQ